MVLKLATRKMMVNPVNSRTAFDCFTAMFLPVWFKKIKLILKLSTAILIFLFQQLNG